MSLFSVFTFLASQSFARAVDVASVRCPFRKVSQRILARTHARTSLGLTFGSALQKFALPWWVGFLRVLVRSRARLFPVSLAVERPGGETTL